MRTTIGMTTAALAAFLFLTATSGDAALVRGSGASDVLFGLDDDDIDDPEIQPAGVAANQSLNNADLIHGLGGHDVMIGLLGSDTMLGGPGGDGSDLFDGGAGNFDALVFGTIDRASNIPTLSPATGKYRDTALPTANVTGQGGFCRIEQVADPVARGFDFLVRFFSRATGNLLVTVRTRNVEQVFCTSEAGGAITYADLTEVDPQLVEVSIDQVEDLNRTVGAIIR